MRQVMYRQIYGAVSGPVVRTCRPPNPASRFDRQFLINARTVPCSSEILIRQGNHFKCCIQHRVSFLASTTALLVLALRATLRPARYNICARSTARAPSPFFPCLGYRNFGMDPLRRARKFSVWVEGLGIAPNLGGLQAL